MKRHFLWLLAIIPLLCSNSIQAQTDLESSDLKAKTELKKESKKEYEKEEEEHEDMESETKHRNSAWYKKMQKPEANYFAIKNSYDRYFNKHQMEHGKTRETGEGWIKSKIYYLDKKGKVQDEPALIPSLQAAKLAATGTTTRTVGTWHMIGPVNSANYNYSGFGNRGGYVFMNRIDPTDPNKMFISFLTGGLWMTSDGGTSWTLTDSNMPDSNYLDIDVAISNHSVVYALSRTQVIKSIDGGLSWTSTNLNTTNHPGTPYDIAVSRTDSNVVIAKWDSKMYRTADGGTTWSEVLTGLPNEYQINDCSIQSEILDWSTTDTNVVYYTSTSNNNKVTVYRSGDAGLTFAIMNTITLDASANGQVVGWAKLLLPSNNANEIYVAIGTGENTGAHKAVHLYKINNTTGVEVLKRVNMLEGLTNETGIHHGDISMDRTNENKIVYGTYLPHYAFYSTNNGVSFTQSVTDQHSDFRSVDMANGRVMVGTDGESELSTDDGINFLPLTNSISNHELWGFGSAFKTSIVAAGLNHGPAMVNEAGHGFDWYNMTGADQGNTDVNPLDDRYIYSQGYDRYRFFRTGLHTYINETNFLDVGGVYDYYNNIEFHPNLYYSMITHHAGNTPTSTPAKAILKNSLIKSEDNGATISVVHTFTDQLFREKICMTDPKIIYAVVGLSNNRVWKTTDGGTIWTDVTPTAEQSSSQTNISDIAIGDSDPNQVWITYSGVQSTCKVLKSSNGGTSWTNLTQAILTTFPNTKIIFQRGSDGGVYVGNKSGIYYRNNTMANWVMLGNGLPMVEVRNMFINYNLGKLRIGTSRGAWENDLYEVSPPKAQISASTNKLTCSAQPVQFKDYSTVRNASATWAWTFTGGTPATSTLENPVVSYAGQADGNYSVSLTVTDAYGTSSQTLTDFIQIAATSVALPFAKDFEDTFPPTDVVLSSTGTGHKWVQNSSVSGFGTSTKCASFVNHGTGQSGVTASMTTNPINLSSPGWTGATLTFDEAYAQYQTSADALTVSVSTDCGTTFTEIYRKTGADLSTAPATSSYFTPTAVQWRKETVDISSYLNKIVTFKVSFISAGGNNIYLDNLKINQVYPITASTNATGTISPVGITQVNPGDSKTYTITPKSCQTLSQVLIDGVNDTAAVAAKSYTFTNVTAAHTISAVFNAVTWNGTSWSNGTGPTSTSPVEFTGNYTATANLSACTIDVNNNAVVNIASGFNVTLSDALNVNSGSFTLENNANLIQTNTATTVINTGNIIVKRNSATLKLYDYTLWSSPVSGQKLQAFSPLTLASRFYDYSVWDNLYYVIPAPSTTNFALGTGYLIRMPNNHPTTPTIWNGTFTGVPNNGNISVTTTVTTDQYNGIGNPYPSTISADAFIDANGITEALYFWRKTNGIAGTTYATYTKAGAVGTPGNGGITPNGTIQVGQGFIAKLTSGTLSFTNAMRTANNSNQFLKTKAIEKNRIWLNLSKDAAPINQMMVAYMTDATDGIDATLDGKFFNDSQVALNSLVNNEEYAIQAKGLPFQDSDIVPLAFKTTEAGSYTIAIDQVDGLFTGNQDVFVNDKVKGTSQNLKTAAYTFTADAGTYNNRFELVYKTSAALGIESQELTADNVVVYKENGIIAINAGKSSLKTVRVFDIRGALLFEQKDINATTTVLKNFRAQQQTLVIQITSNDNKVISKKVIF